MIIVSNFIIHCRWTDNSIFKRSQTTRIWWYICNVLIIIILYYDYKNRQLKLYRGIDKILNFKKYCLQNIDMYNADHKKCKIHKKIHCVDWLTVIQQNNCNRLIIKIESQLFREHVKVVIRKRISATLLSFTSSSYVCVIT